MYCLETWRQKGWGRAQGAGISAPPPRPWDASRKGPLQPVIWPWGESRGRGMDTVTTGGLKFPSLAAGRLKCAPMGVGWGGALPPTPQSLAFVLWVGCLFRDLHAPLEQMGEPVPMDDADDIEDSGLEEDPGQPQASPDSRSGCARLQQGRPGPLPHRATARQWTSGW